MDNTAFHNAFQEFISRKGMNATAQRRIIAEVFFRFPGHHSLEEFYQRVQQQDSSIGQTTVYRTLKLLCEAGLAMEIHFSDGIARYELAASDSHHDHMVCVACGKVIEIFGKSRLGEVAKEHGIVNTAKIPFDASLASCCDKGLVELFEGDYVNKLFEGLEKN